MRRIEFGVILDTCGLAQCATVCMEVDATVQHVLGFECMCTCVQVVFMQCRLFVGMYKLTRCMWVGDA